MLDENAATTIFPLVLVKNLLECVDHVEFRAGESLPIDVGTVAEQREHAPAAELGQTVNIELLAVEWGLIELEVAGVDDRAGR